MRIKRNAWALLVCVAAAGAVPACSDDDGTGPPPPPASLTTQEQAALYEAIQDAYRTYYTYTAVVEDLGSVEPFVTLAATEQAYVEELADLYRAVGATPPASIWNSGNVPQFQNREQACLAAEESEVATGLMFQRVLRFTLRNQIRDEFQQQREAARNAHRLAFRNCVGGSVSPLTGDVAASVEDAIQDEYRMFYTYTGVVDDLGDEQPFVSIRDAEWMHVGALANLYEKRSLDVPESTWDVGNVPTYATRQAACAAGVEGEIANVLMYDEMLLQQLPADVERVFENLRAASLEHHLPAFQQCAGAGSEPASAEVQAAMEEAIQDEYRAYFTYSAVVEDIEPDYPFPAIRDAEESHYTAVANLYVKRGLDVPASDWSLSNVPRYGTLVEACAAAVTGEENNIAMYDRLLALTLPDDIRSVFGNLRAASLDRHLPAFQACAN